MAGNSRTRYGSTSGVPGLGSQPAYFPNDSHLRGVDRRLRRQLPPSDGNPAGVPGDFQQTGPGLTPESLQPSGVLDAVSGKFGLHHNNGNGP